MEQEEFKGTLSIYWATGTEGYDWIFCYKEWKDGPMRLLENGDKLTVLDKDDPSKIVWEGVIELQPHINHQAKKTSIQHCTHADQKDVECKIWEKYFAEHYPAKFVPASQ